MANMSYCRFENTLGDLRDCRDALSDGDEISRSEKNAYKRLVEVCREIVEFANAEDEYEAEGIREVQGFAESEEE